MEELVYRAFECSKTSNPMGKEMAVQSVTTSELSIVKVVGLTCPIA